MAETQGQSVSKSMAATERMVKETGGRNMKMIRPEQARKTKRAMEQRTKGGRR